MTINQTEADDWLLRNAEQIKADIAEAEEQIARGEFYSPEEVRAFLAERRAARTA